MSIIKLQNAMLARELLNKWRRNEDWLETFIIEGRITAYTFKGRDHYGVYVDDYYHEGYLWQENVTVVFDPDEIERIERDHPEVITSPPPPRPSWPTPPLTAPKVTMPFATPPAGAAPPPHLAKAHLSTVEPLCPGAGRKTPGELLQLHEREPQRWTLKALAEEFGGDPTEPFSTKKSRIVRALEKAKKERGDSGSDA